MPRSAQVARIAVPAQAHIEGEYLLIPEDAPIRARRPDHEILERFLEIDSPEAALSFLKRYGPIFGVNIQPEHGAFREPLADWYRLVRQLKVIRDAAGYLNAGQPPPKDVSALLLGNSKFARRIRKPSQENIALGVRLAVATRISRLLDIAELRPQLIWNEKFSRWNLTLTSFPSIGMAAVSDSCLGALVWQLILEVTDSRGFAFCSLCGNAYPSKRSPSEGRGNYCPTCRENGAMWRHLKQLQRQKGKAHAKTTRSE
jgi:hypothetical protein